MSSRPLEEGYLDCVHCGLCLSSCPTYRVLGNEMDSPRGRIYLIRALDEGRTAITDSFVDHMFRCLDCRACETACPSGVRFGEMMEQARGRVVRERSAGTILRLILNHVFPHPWRLHLATRLSQVYQQSGLSGFVRSTGLLERVSPRFAAAERMMPELEVESGVRAGTFHLARVEKRLGRVALFSGCVMNSMLGRVNRATIRLLTASGFDVAVPEEQVCCGALANHAGLRDAAAAMARDNLRAFPLSEVDAIIVNASGCSAMLTEYPLLIQGSEEFSAKVQDISSFLASTSIRDCLTSSPELRVGYDDPCHLIHAQGIRSQPRSLLEAVPGVRLVEVTGADECCGSAGIYNLTHPELAMEILDRKMDRVRQADLDVLVTGNPGCLFQLEYGARRHELDIEVVHIAEFLSRSLEPSFAERII